MIKNPGLTLNSRQIQTGSPAFDNFRQKGSLKKGVVVSVKKPQTLPGTTVTVEETEDIRKVMHGLFSAGGLVLSQVTSLTGMEGYIIQNWVKRGFVSPPVAKKYSENQLCRLIIINLLKDCLSLTEIADLLSYINGKLDDESDDMIEDSLLYFCFTRCLFYIDTGSARSAEEAAAMVAADYGEKCADGGKEKLETVLTVMQWAYTSARLCQNAKSRLEELPKAGKTQSDTKQNSII